MLQNILLSRRVWALASCVMLLILALVGLMLWLGQWLIPLANTALANQDMHQFQQLLVQLMMFVVVLGGLSALRIFLSSLLSEHIGQQLRLKLLNHLLHVPQWVRDQHLTGDWVATMNADVQQLMTLIDTQLPMLMRHMLMMLGAFSLMIWVSASLTSNLLLMVPVLIAVVWSVGRLVRQQSRRNQHQVAQLFAHMGELLASLLTVKVMRAEQWVLQSVSKQYQHYFAMTRRRAVLRSLLVALMMWVVLTGMAWLLWQGGQRVITGQLSAGHLISFLYYAVLAASGLAAVGDIAGELQRVRGVVDHILTLTKLPQSPPTKHDDTPSRLPTSGLIKLDNVFLSYAGQNSRLALDDVSLLVPNGQSVAVVGPSGQGKSTLLKLLSGIYMHQHGVVQVGVSVRHGCVDDQTHETAWPTMRDHVAFMPQEMHLLSTDVRTNLLLADPHATDAQLWQALQLACADEFVRNLPQQLDTPLGENGLQLSGGQRQRIVLARLFLQQADVYVCDEPLVGLDVPTREQCLKNLLQHVKRRTFIMTTHDLSILSQFDRVLLIQHGQIVADGRIDELQQNSAAFKLWRDRAKQEDAAS